MPKRRASFLVPSLRPVELHSGLVGRQLAQRLRDAIANGELKPGERLPSTRTLAMSLGVARGTVVEVFGQLTAEGYLNAKVGAGTRVAQALGDTPLMPSTALAVRRMDSGLPLPPAVSRLAAVARLLVPQPPVPFAVAVPAGGIAPDDTWRRLGNRIRASRRAAPASYADSLGLPELRVAIAAYVRRARAVHCEMENVVITSGTQQGLYMAGRVLLSQGDAVWAENPAYPGLTAVLDELGVQTHRVPVDEHGLNVVQGLSINPNARAAFVTPSHQYPVGMPMSMARRQALLTWAEQTNAWIVEDDYDSELRYAGHPFPAMQGLNPTRVIYLGTFSKVLFPSLRLGYLIAPAPLIEAFAGARAIIDRHSPLTDQHVLAAYMQEGCFDAHVRRIRNLYSERRSVLLDALAASLPPGWTIQHCDQGMHIVVWLPDAVDDVKIATRLQTAGIVTRAISPMYANQIGRPGLMLGFGGFPAEGLREAAARLGSLVRRA